MKLGRYLNIYLLACWLVMLTKLLTMKLTISTVNIFSFDDKLVHMFLFAGLVYFIVEAIEGFYLFKYRYVVIVAFISSVAYAQIMELVQASMPSRTNSVYDLLAGATGAAIAALIVYWLDYRKTARPKLLLHMCCIGCGIAVIEQLNAEYEIVLYFYNPNIFPFVEYKKRLEEIKKVAMQKKIHVIVAHALHGRWLKKIKGHESDPERGGRCVICYRDRLEMTARRASRSGFNAFTSTLSISPHKNYPVIKKLGDELALKYKVNFLDNDFKKKGGFARTCELSRELGLYRQDYCGCEFSLADSIKRKKND